MDNLEMAMKLLTQAENEKQRLKEYNVIYKEYLKTNDWKGLNAFGKTPSKAFIKSCLKMARRFLSDEFKDIDKI